MGYQKRADEEYKTKISKVRMRGMRHLQEQNLPSHVSSKKAGRIMSVYLCIPSARPAAEAQACVDKWSKQGYLVALFRDTGMDLVDCDYVEYGEYQGYSRTTNRLIKSVLAMDTACQFVITGGDDTDPDPNKRADEIAEECRAYFHGVACAAGIQRACEHYSETFGVMQPTGDRFAEGSIDRIAGSPWIGREFCERAYGGKGPYYHEYGHMFVDEEIMEVAKKLGVFWQRPDLTHLHHHFMRTSTAINSGAQAKSIPPHLIEANSPAHWARYQAMYLGRKAAGFPGHQLS